MKDFVSKNKIKTRNTELNGSQIVLLITNQEERRYAKVSLGCPGVLQKSDLHRTRIFVVDCVFV